MAEMARAARELRGWSGEKAVKARTADRPTQAAPGKRMPAAVNGFAQPMIPSGGGTLASTATGARQRAAQRSGDHMAAKGSPRRLLANPQSAMGSCRLVPGPKDDFAPGIRIEDAAA